MGQTGGVTTPAAPNRARRSRTRMTAVQRREQLIEISRELFAERGYEGTAVEEIAARAGVSKPVVYEHFGGKEGAYAVVVDRETQTLHNAIRNALTTPGARSRELLERGAMALLDYIEHRPDGFRILSRDPSSVHTAGQTGGSFASILSDIAVQVEDILASEFSRTGHDPQFAGLYAQALVGLVAQTGQQWLDSREPSREIVARHLINLAWNGMAHLKPDPKLIMETIDKRRDKIAVEDGPQEEPRSRRRK
ncbi:TetR/AcrR family transcriptional regulator [Tessaracoccus sp. MC1756]|nr:TetR/AcrR family transcriptional regulator [Tessaracoccus sp. MC1756]